MPQVIYRFTKNEDAEFRGQRVLASASGQAEPAPAASADDYPAHWASRVAHPSRFQVTASETPGGASLLPDTDYPANWLIGSSTRAQVIAARGGRPAQRVVHAAGDTSRLLEAVRRAADDARLASQSSTVGAGYSDSHRDVAAAGDNARRLQEARIVEEQRMAREVWNRNR